MITKKKPRTPRQATTHDQICDLPRDNWVVGDYWMMLQEGEVTLAHQKNGEPAQFMVNIPRRVWHAFIRAYETGATRNRK